MKMKHMSVCLVRYNMCFVFIADNRRAVGGEKTAAIDFVCWAGVSPFHSLVDTHTRSRVHREGEGVIHHSGQHTHTYTHEKMHKSSVSSERTQGLSGNRSYLITRQHNHKHIHTHMQD